jgi:hypothetical protein
LPALLGVGGEVVVGDVDGGGEHLIEGEPVREVGCVDRGGGGPGFAGGEDVDGVGGNAVRIVR